MADNRADLAKTTHETADERLPAGERTLDCCYGQIGISAVAAAVRYQGSAKNPAYAPTSSNWRHKFAEAAA
jgi:hypothetical protein